MDINVPVTVIIAARNEEANLVKCLEALQPAKEIFIIDSNSTDRTQEIACSCGVKVIQFEYRGGYPKKRQWALDNLPIYTPWILLIDADEVVPGELWQEIAAVIDNDNAADAYLVTKGFHFMGRKMRFGGFSHRAVVLFKTGRARFEHLLDEPANAPDMEIHERLIVDGMIDTLKTPLVHEDCKGLDAYWKKHEEYAQWEARVRYNYLVNNTWGTDTIAPDWCGNVQQRRRALKQVAIRLPYEPFFWFVYHYIFRLGFLEGRAGYLASRLRARYIKKAREYLGELMHA